MFIRGTCFCDECREHEAAMQDFHRDDLPLDQLNNPGWDPISFASEEAFAYLLPGLVWIVLNHTEDYVQSFLFHLENRDRIALFTEKQAQTLLHVLDFLMLEHSEILDRNLMVDELIRTREILEQAAAPLR